MNLNYHHLYYFWQVAKNGSFSLAAESLRVSQSAISEQVSLLEENLQMKLFERAKR